MTKPLKTEKFPINSLWVPPFKDGYPYKVQIGDTWVSLAKKRSITADELMFFNFKTYNHDEINWLLRVIVGCHITKDNGLNWSFDGANPGIIYIPNRQISGDAMVIKSKPGVHGVISVPEYDDSNFYSIIGKALDIQALLDTSIAVWGIELGSVELGAIGVGALSMVIAPLAAVGSGWNDALQNRNRNYFFDGFSLGLIIGINGGNISYIKNHYAKYYPVFEPMFPEKAVTFKNLYNAGLVIGFKKAADFNEVDKYDFYNFLKAQVSQDEIEEYWTTPQSSWSPEKQRDFLERMAHIIKLNLLAKNLRLRFH